MLNLKNKSQEQRLDCVNAPPLDLPEAVDLEYDLPDERIAKRPAEPRDSSCLLVSDASIGSGKIWYTHHHHQVVLYWYPVHASCIAWQLMVQLCNHYHHLIPFVLSHKQTALWCVTISFVIYIHCYHQMHCWWWINLVSLQHVCWWIKKALEAKQRYVTTGLDCDRYIAWCMPKSMLKYSYTFLYHFFPSYHAHGHRSYVSHQLNHLLIQQLLWWQNQVKLHGNVWLVANVSNQAQGLSWKLMCPAQKKR